MCIRASFPITSHSHVYRDFLLSRRLLYCRTNDRVRLSTTNADYLDFRVSRRLYINNGRTWLSICEVEASRREVTVTIPVTTNHWGCMAPPNTATEGNSYYWSLRQYSPTRHLTELMNIKISLDKQTITLIESPLLFCTTTFKQYFLALQQEIMIIYP